MYYFPIPDGLFQHNVPHDKGFTCSTRLCLLNSDKRHRHFCISFVHMYCFRHSTSVLLAANQQAPILRFNEVPRQGWVRDRNSRCER